MSRALSIHIGVNTPAGRMGGFPLNQSEDAAWQMAVLANQAGYDSLLLLRGESATRQAVHHALTGAAGMLVAGDSLLVTYSGHGTQVRDLNKDEWGGTDEGWCLGDDVLLDDKLSGYWRLFEPGVRIVVVSESCYSGGMDRDDKVDGNGVFHPAAPVYRDDVPAVGVDYTRSCIAEPPKDSLGIHASVLLLTASRKDQVSSEGLFSRHLLDVWDNGDFEGSYCDLHRAVRDLVMLEKCEQEPQILMLGSGDPGFPLERAFHVRRRAGVYRSAARSA
jgi:metacaspase-1